MPKPANCFFLFCLENRTSFLEEYPSATNSEITSLLAKTWRSLSPAEKALYQNTSKKLRDVSSSRKIKILKLIDYNQNFKLQNPDYRTPEKEVDQFQFSFKLSSPDKPIKKKTKGKKVHKTNVPTNTNKSRTFDMKYFREVYRQYLYENNGHQNMFSPDYGVYCANPSRKCY